MEVPVRNLAGEVVSTIEVLDAVFSVPVNPPLIYQAAVRYEANQRQGTRDTRTRGEVVGGGRKPYRQKGTGRARQGSIRAPHFRKGGVVFGPHPREFRQEMPVKMRRAALRSALSGKLADEELLVVVDFALPEPKTRLMAEALRKLGTTRTVVLVTAEPDPLVIRSARNIPGVDITYAATLNIGDVLKHRHVVMSVEAVRRVEARLKPPALLAAPTGAEAGDE
ncbi:MAG: 50S ribosomal protein L4 [Chloroflexi bacterium]|nr:50S ribosomal protein L4 [Chloroflexota bacterium]GIW12448.1 MAG: 50S ribosomal protein L4 [Dehalococcoidia bacterium]